MRIGDLRHRLSIQERTDSVDADGRRTAVWANIGTDPTVWAKVEPLSASETFVASQSRTKASHRVTIRDRTDVTSIMRLTGTVHSASRTFKIRGIRRLPDEGAAQWLELLCEEDTAQ